jgi:hypothetical protein
VFIHTCAFYSSTKFRLLMYSFFKKTTYPIQAASFVSVHSFFSFSKENIESYLIFFRENYLNFCRRPCLTFVMVTFCFSLLSGAAEAVNATVFSFFTCSFYPCFLIICSIGFSIKVLCSSFYLLNSSCCLSNLIFNYL